MGRTTPGDTPRARRETGGDTGDWALKRKLPVLLARGFVPLIASPTTLVAKRGNRCWQSKRTPILFRVACVSDFSRCTGTGPRKFTAAGGRAQTEREGAASGPGVES